MSDGGPFLSPESNGPDHAGHRQRLRERALKGGPAALPDYELLELFLFRSIPQRDVKPLAKALLREFGSLQGVLAAPRDELKRVSSTDSKGRNLKVSDDIALDLILMFEATQRMMAVAARREIVIGSWSAMMDYVRVAMAHETREQFRVLFLDKKNQLVRDEVMGQGTIDHAPAYPREIMRRALELGSSNVILVHNHPSGDPSPSRGDIDLTRAVVEAGLTLGITVHDHLIVGRDGIASLRQLGLM